MGQAKLVPDQNDTPVFVKWFPINCICTDLTKTVKRYILIQTMQFVHTCSSCFPEITGNKSSMWHQVVSGWQRWESSSEVWISISHQNVWGRLGLGAVRQTLHTPPWSWQSDARTVTTQPSVTQLHPDRNERLSSEGHCSQMMKSVWAQRAIKGQSWMHIRLIHQFTCEIQVSRSGPLTWYKIRIS